MYIFNGILFALILLFIFAVNLYNYRRESVRHKLLHWFRASRELLLLEQVSGKEKHTLLYDIEALEKIFRAAATDPAPCCCGSSPSTSPPATTGCSAS